jgi:hypothetical protein
MEGADGGESPEKKGCDGVLRTTRKMAMGAAFLPKTRKNTPKTASKEGFFAVLKKAR